MDLQTRIRIAKQDVFGAFEQSDTGVFTLAEIRSLLRHNRHDWRVQESATAEQFLGVIKKLRRSLLTEIILPSLE